MYIIILCLGALLWRVIYTLVYISSMLWSWASRRTRPSRASRASRPSGVWAQSTAPAPHIMHFRSRDGLRELRELRELRACGRFGMALARLSEILANENRASARDSTPNMSSRPRFGTSTALPLEFQPHSLKNLFSRAGLTPNICSRSRFHMSAARPLESQPLLLDNSLLRVQCIGSAPARTRCTKSISKLTL